MYNCTFSSRHILQNFILFLSAPTKDRVVWTVDGIIGSALSRGNRPDDHSDVQKGSEGVLGMA